MARAPSVPVATALGIVVALAAAAAFRGTEGKSCTNAFPGLASHSHTERAAAQLRSGPPATALEPTGHRGHGHDHGHEQHLTSTDESTWMSLMPRRALRREEAFDWLMLYRKLLGATAGAPRPGRSSPRPPCTTCGLSRAAYTGKPSRPTWSTCSFWTSTASSGASASRSA